MKYLLNNSFTLLETFVSFTSTNFEASELAGSLIVTLEVSGKTHSQSFTVYVTAKENNSTAFPATGNIIQS